MMSRFFRQVWLIVIGAIASTILGWLLLEQIERERQRQEALAAEREGLVVMPPAPVSPSQQPAKAIRPPLPAAAPPKEEAPPTREVPAAKVQPPRQPDDFTQIKGIGPAYARALNEAGIHSYSELAMQKPAELLSHLNSRVSIERVREWIKQAKQLSADENSS
ncbi:MAG TPA: DUF4332 domain-containing protein [Aggregatilineales bacterium]|nr:DUF4332 domain-containing protein [Aggregatilineales bacterium]